MNLALISGKGIMAHCMLFTWQEHMKVCARGDTEEKAVEEAKGHTHFITSHSQSNLPSPERCDPGGEGTGQLECYTTWGPELASQHPWKKPCVGSVAVIPALEWQRQLGPWGSLDASPSWSKIDSPKGHSRLTSSVYACMPSHMWIDT